jgi:hypothetical protein
VRLTVYRGELAAKVAINVSQKFFRYVRPAMKLLPAATEEKEKKQRDAQQDECARPNEPAAFRTVTTNKDAAR